MSKCGHYFECDGQHVNTLSHSHVLLPQIIAYMNTKVLVLVVMEWKHASVTSVLVDIFTLYFKVNRVCTENPAFIGTNCTEP